MGTKTAMRPSRTPTTQTLSPLALALFLLAAGALTGACGDRDAASQAPAPAWGGARPPAVVTTAPVEQGAFAVDAHFVGTLEAKSAADLYARTSGQIVQVFADAGDRVHAGQLLARIEPDEAEKKVEQSEAALHVAEATIAQRRANLQIAQATATRTETLFAQDLVSQQDYDSVQADLVGARSQLELAKAQVEQAQANVSAARLELSKTRVIAPFDGWVGKRYLDLGALASTNRPVFSVVDLSTIKTTISLTEKDASHVHAGQPATLTTDAFPGKVFRGQVARIASVFDPETNTTEAQIEVANPQAALKPGMFADVAVAYRTDPTAILVPTSAVVDGESESHVFLAERADRAGASPRPAASRGESPPSPWIAHKVTVRVVGTGAGGQAAIEAEDAENPLAAGSQVIVLGQEALVDGAPVTLSDGGAGAAAAAPKPIAPEARS